MDNMVEVVMVADKVDGLVSNRNNVNQDNLEDWMFQQQSLQDRVETTGDSKIEIRNSLTTEIRNLIRDKEDKVETLV